MKKSLKHLITLGLTALMVVSSFTTAFAFTIEKVAIKDSVMTIAGQKPDLTMGYKEESQWVGKREVYQYDIYLKGRDTLHASDIQIEGDWNIEVLDASTNPEGEMYAWTGQSLNIPKYNGEDREVTLILTKKVGDWDIEYNYNFMANPGYATIEGYYLENIINLDTGSKERFTTQAYTTFNGVETGLWVLYKDRTGTLYTYDENTDVYTPSGKYADINTLDVNVFSGGATGRILDENEVQKESTVAVSTSEKGHGYWMQDSKGWWIQYHDGTYLTNGWYQSPASKLWYYMGADGYMLTNTTTPDGYYVNANGVWVQNYEQPKQNVAESLVNNANTVDVNTQTATVTTGKSIVGKIGRQYYEFDNVEVIEGFYNPNSGLPKQPDSYVINPGHKDDSKHVWQFKLMDTLDGEAVYVNINFEESWYPYEKYIKMMFTSWLQHPEYGMDFWELELKGGRTSKYYPSFGAYVYSDAIYDEITSIVKEYLPHDEDNAVTYTGQGLTEKVKAK